MKYSPILMASVAPTLISAIALTGCTDLTPYTIKAGDTLTKIAEANKISLDLLESFNVAATSFDSISINQTVLIPNAGCVFDLCTIVANHTVKAGEELGGIAAMSNSTVAAILSVNPQISNPNFILTKDTIRIPAPSCSILHKTVIATDNCIDSANASKTYTVVSGDVFFSIANEKLGVTLDSLKAANPQVKDFDVIEVGQVLNTPLCRVCVSPTNAQYANGIYKVVSGDTFKIISRQKLNITLAAFEGANAQVKDFNVIEVDQELKVPICAPGTKARRSNILY